MQNDKMKDKKIPRFLLAHDDLSQMVIEEARVMWPDGTQSSICDIGAGGISVLPVSLPQRVKLGDYFELKFRFYHQEPQILKVRLVRMTSKVWGFRYEHSVMDGRLKVEQVVRDTMVIRYARPMLTSSLPSEWQPSVWVHAPFDTNILLWRSSGGALEKWVIEYDNLILSYDQKEWTLTRSSASAEDEVSYFTDKLLKASAKIRAGYNWKDRLLKVIDAIESLGDDRSVIHSQLENFEKSS